MSGMASKYPPKISEIELINVSKRIGPSYYAVLGDNLEFCQAELENIKVGCQSDVQKAIHTILSRWNAGRPLNENSREVLANILDDTELKSIGDLLRISHESLFRGSSKASRLNQGLPTTPLTPTQSPVKSTTISTSRTSTSSSSPKSIDSTINLITGLISGLLPQHSSHVYNATKSDTVKVVLTTSNNEDIERVLNPKGVCRIPTPYGRVRISVYTKDDADDFERKASATWVDDSDRSFIVRKSKDGNKFVIVRSVYGHLYTEDTS